jgi:hypothetical protein
LVVDGNRLVQRTLDVFIPGEPDSEYIVTVFTIIKRDEPGHEAVRWRPIQSYSISGDTSASPRQCAREAAWILALAITADADETPNNGRPIFLGNRQHLLAFAKVCGGAFPSVFRTDYLCAPPSMSVQINEEVFHRRLQKTRAAGKVCMRCCFTFL